MLDLIERQRRDHHVVAGAIVLTTIRPDAITQKILHRYPDRIGDCVRPMGAATEAMDT